MVFFDWGYLLLLPLQSPFVFLSVCTTGVIWWKYVRRRSVRTVGVAILIVLPILFCAWHVSIRRNRNIQIDNEMQAGLVQIGERQMDGTISYRPMTAAEIEQAVANDVGHTYYPFAEEWITALVFVGLSTLPRVLPDRSRDIHARDRNDESTEVLVP